MSDNILGYKVNQKISEDLNFTIYRVTDDLNRSFILKILNKVSTDKDLRNQLIKEFEISQKLINNKIIKYYKLEVYNNTLAIVIEDFKSITLDKFISINKLDIKQFIEISIKITEAIEFIHNNKIIHNSINPKNILINDDLDIKIVNLGLGIYQDKPEMIDTKFIKGSINYISPEQTGRINEMIDTRSDLYSLGATLYKLWTKNIPYDDLDIDEIIYAHIAKRLEEPYLINSDIPKQISLIIMKLLNKNKLERYQVAENLNHDLKICLNEYKINHRIKSFDLGELDYKYKFIIPNKLYGREKELEQLVDAFKNQTSNLFIIRGSLGAGKSSLVNGFQNILSEQNAIFISGKFEQFKNNTPYQVIIDSFSHLLNNYLFKSEKDLNELREQITSKLGENISIISNIIPEIETIFEQSFSDIELNTLQEQNRFKKTFLDFIEIFTEEHLIIHLDDLQWADEATLEMLPLILKIKNITIIATYRIEEKQEQLYIDFISSYIKNNEILFQEILLNNLNIGDINKLLQDTLKRNDTDELAKLIYSKTNGEAFFVNQFLNTLYKEKVFEFNDKLNYWEFDLIRIESFTFTDNAVKLINHKISLLPEETKKLLSYASVIGNNFDDDLLSYISNYKKSDITNILRIAMEDGIINLINYKYKKRFYRFSHDQFINTMYYLLNITQVATLNK